MILYLYGLNKLIELREKLKERSPKDSIFDPPFSTLQVGGIFGGIAHNVIADKCYINWETRPVIKEDGIFLNKELDDFTYKIFCYNTGKYEFWTHHTIKKI